MFLEVVTCFIFLLFMLLLINTIITPVGSLGALYSQRQLSNTGKVIQPAINFLDEIAQKKPKNLFDSLYMPIVMPSIGLGVQGLSLVGSLDNLGDQIYTAWSGKESTRKHIAIKGTVEEPLIKNLLEGNDLSQYSKDYTEYFGKYNVNSIMGQLGAFAIGAPSVKSAVKAVPIRFQKFGQPGVKLFENIVSKKIKTPIGTPQVITREVIPKTLSVGYGTHAKSIFSKVGSKITLGDAKLSKNIESFVTQSTGKQVQRGVKMAADSSRFEQVLASQIIPKIQGITPISKDKAETIESIISIVTKPKKDTVISKKIPDDAFSSITKTEQPSFTGALSKAQGRLFNPIDTFEGSLSHAYFVLPKFMRRFGDVDLHASTYEKAASQIRRLTPDIKADPGREFVSVINPKTKSAKIFVQSKNIESGVVLYHGTTPLNAKNILKDGFDLSKSKLSDRSIFTATDSRGSYGHMGSNLKITMKKNAKVFDFNKTDFDWGK